jgi:hypothetical protein
MELPYVALSPHVARPPAKLYFGDEAARIFGDIPWAFQTADLSRREPEGLPQAANLR